MLHFKTKKKEKHLEISLFYNCVPNIEREGLKLVILGHFLPFYSPKNSKNQNFFKKKKNCCRYHHFTRVYQKSQSYDARFLRYGVRQTEFLSFWVSFCPFTLLTIRKIKILTK